MMDNKELVILAGKGGGGDATPAGIVNATRSMTDQQKADTLDNLGAEPEKFVVTVTDGTPPTANKSFSEIFAAYTAGKPLDVVMSGDHYVPVYIASDEMYFVKAYADEYSGTISRLYVSDSNVWTASLFSVQRRPATYNIVSTTPSLTPAIDSIYNYTAAALTSLTVINPPATGSYTIKFNSGSTATTTTIPSTIKGLESFAAEANTHYEINVEDNYAVVGKWAIS